MSKRYVKYDFYENGVEESIEGEKVNQIIEEIIEIMRENKVTVGTAKNILEDTISSIIKDTTITQNAQAFHVKFEPRVHFQKGHENCYE